MKFPALTIICVILLFMIPLYQALGQGQSTVQYQIMINNDSSATWTITVVTNINATVDSWSGFLQRITTLVSACANVTGRAMEIDPNSPQLETMIGTQDKITTYTFAWENFSVIQNGEIKFGDVFKVTDFFSQLLYGDGDLQISFPPTYTVNSVSPLPDQQIGNQTLHWYRTQDFISGKPSVTLTLVSPKGSSSPGSLTGSSLPLIQVVGAVLVTAVAVSLLSFYFTRRSRGEKANASTIVPAVVDAFESDEDEVLRLLRSSGGSLNQSDIAERCRFSKAKTSQLLSALEARGVVRRYKKGRDKIVNFNEQAKGEK